MIAILGDSHIPGRANKLPEPLLKEIRKARPDKILFTGDAITPSVLDELRGIAPVVHVKGNMDTLDAPKETVVSWDVPILLTHGSGILPRGDHAQLEAMAVAHRCKLVVTGHTHQPEVWKGSKAILLNPGSATGAWGGDGAVYPPSIMLLESNQKLIRATLYSLEGMEVKAKSWNVDLS